MRKNSGQPFTLYHWEPPAINYLHRATPTHLLIKSFNIRGTLPGWGTTVYFLIAHPVFCTQVNMIVDKYCSKTRIQSQVASNPDDWRNWYSSIWPNAEIWQPTIPWMPKKPSIRWFSSHLMALWQELLPIFLAVHHLRHPNPLEMTINWEFHQARHCNQNSQ